MIHGPTAESALTQLELLGRRAVAEHVARARDLLAVANYDALLVLSDGSLATRGHVSYFSYFETLTYWSALLLTADEVVLFAPTPVAYEWALVQAAPETTVVGVPATPAGFAAAISERLGRRAAGVVNGSRFAVVTLLDPKISTGPADGDLRGLTFTKSPADLELVDASIAVVDDAFARVPALIAAEVTERELRAEMNHVLDAAGLGAGLTLLSTDARGIPTPTPSASRRISTGVLTLSLEPAAPTGLFTQTVRIFVPGAATPELREGVATARAAIDRFVDVAHDGGSVGSAVRGAGDGSTSQWAQSRRAPLGHTLGWIIGDTPKLEVADETLIAAPAVFAVHPLLERDDGLSVFLGDTIVVEGSGARRPCGFPDLVEVAVA